MLTIDFSVGIVWIVGLMCENEKTRWDNDSYSKTELSTKDRRGF